MKGARRRNRGFLLLEMFSAIALLTVFALIAAPLFNETMRVIERAPAAQDAMTRFESVSEALREDAWGAQRFSAVGANAVEMDLPSEAAVRWQIDSGGDIERIQGADERRWTGVGTDAALEVDGPSVVLRSTGRAADGNGEIRCPSVVQLADAGGKK